MNDALNEAMCGAIEEVSQTVLGKQVQASPAVETRGDDRRYETSVLISFVGDVSGAFALRCTKKLGAAIASQMLGTEVAEGSDDMKDAIGEYFNMVVGAAKTRYATTGEPFKISVPTTIIGEKYVLHVKANAADVMTLLDFRLDADTITVEVYLK
jgi:CheY-specific phosphatase CheX